MSRVSNKKLRLSLHGLGNTYCPICLTQFDRAEVERGKTATLEHVPTKSQGGKPACLTCAVCNHAAGRGIDRALAEALEAQDRGSKVKLTKDGVSHTGRLVSNEELPEVEIRSNPRFPVDDGRPATIEVEE